MNGNADSSQGQPSESLATRRMILAAGAMLLAGCSSQPSSRVAGLPAPWWNTPVNPPTPLPEVDPVSGANPAGVIARSAWAQGSPVPKRMNAAHRITRITIHHDGMQPFTSTGYAAASSRLEAIRRSHLHRRPQRFGDIGYHYAVDPAGRVWAGRPLTYQGAHVGGQNQGNLGIVMLGNYDRQSVNRAQQAALITFVTSQARRYGVSASHIRTHQEMAPTACPGESLQRFVAASRQQRRFA